MPGVICQGGEKMFVNCGCITCDRRGDAIITIWRENGVYKFVIRCEDLDALFSGKTVPVGRTGAPNYGRAALSKPNSGGERKGIVFRVDNIPGKVFTTAKTAVERVRRGEWPCAGIAEIVGRKDDEVREEAAAW